jgi:hypothetical protein
MLSVTLSVEWVDDDKFAWCVSSTNPAGRGMRYSAESLQKALDAVSEEARRSIEQQIEEQLRGSLR